MAAQLPIAAVRRSVAVVPDAEQWSALEAARQAMLPNFRQGHAAERYRSAATVG